MANANQIKNQLRTAAAEHSLILAERTETSRKHNCFQSSFSNPFSDEMIESNETIKTSNQKCAKLIREAKAQNVRTSTIAKIFGDEISGAVQQVINDLFRDDEFARENARYRRQMAY